MPDEDAQVQRILGSVISVLLLLVCIVMAGRSASAVLRPRSREREPPAQDSGSRLRPLVWSLVAVNWFAFSSFSFAIGGTALLGQAAESDCLVRLNPGASATAVSSSVWLFSLIYTALTVGLTPLMLAGTTAVGGPSRPRSLLAWVAIAGSLLVLVLVVAQAAEMLPMCGSQ